MYMFSCNFCKKERRKSCNKFVIIIKEREIRKISAGDFHPSTDHA